MFMIQFEQVPDHYTGNPLCWHFNGLVVAIEPVFFGFRVTLRQQQDLFYLANWCAGAVPEGVNLAMQCLIQAALNMPLDQIRHQSDVKPLWNDPGFTRWMFQNCMPSQTYPPQVDAGSLNQARNVYHLNAI